MYVKKRSILFSELANMEVLTEISANNSTLGQDDTFKLLRDQKVRVGDYVRYIRSNEIEELQAIDLENTKFGIVAGIWVHNRCPLTESKLLLTLSGGHKRFWKVSIANHIFFLKSHRSRAQAGDISDLFKSQAWFKAIQNE